MPRRPRFLAPLALLAALALATAADARALLRAVEGEAWVEGRGGRRAARAGAEVADGEILSTGERGRVDLVLSDASRLSVGPSTMLRVERSRAATTAVSLRRGGVRLASHPARWRSEALQVSTPIATVGVRGTALELRVAPTGEARLFVETGAALLPAVEVAAGEAADLLLDAPPRPAAEAAPEASFARFHAERLAALDRDRRRVAEAMGGFLREAVGRRLGAAAAVWAGLADVGRALRAAGEEDESRFAKQLRVLEAVRSGLESVRTVLAADREAWLREGVLEDLVGRGLPPIAALGARATLAWSARDRAARARDLERLDARLGDVGAAIVSLAGRAAADPTAGRDLARIVEEGLGAPIRGEPIEGPGPRIERADLGLVPGASWRALRTLRGAEDLRVEVATTVEADSTGLWVRRAPEAFDSTVALHVVESGPALLLDGFEGRLFGPGRGADLLPLVLYRFPIALGDTWLALRRPGLGGGIRIERRVAAAERIRTPMGALDCLRIETRLLIGRLRREPLIHVEWVAPGVGQVREMSFRGELRSMSWEERLTEGTGSTIGSL